MILHSLATVALFTPQEPPTGLFIDRATVVQDKTLTPADDLYFVPAGPGPVVPAQFGSVYPPFARSIMLPVAGITFGGFSAGTDRIPVDEGTGHVIVDGDEIEWGFLMFVVGGIDGGSDPLYAAEALGPGGVGADIFTYWYPRSAIADDYVDLIEKARDGLDMNLTRISGMDHSLGDLVLAPAIADMAEEVTQTFFFTIDADTLANAAGNPAIAAWFDPSTPNSATILQMTRTGSTWSPPVLFLTDAELGLDPSDEITALCVDQINHRVLLGTRTPGRQLWVATYEGIFTDANYIGEFLAGNGQPLATEKLRLRPTETVEAACSGDPGQDAGGAALLIDYTSGRPGGPDPQPRPPHEISIFRGYDRPSDTDLIDVYLGSLDRLPGNTATALIYVNGVIDGVRIFNPATQRVIRHRIPVVPLAYPGDWRIQTQVFSALGTHWSHVFTIKP